MPFIQATKFYSKVCVTEKVQNEFSPFGWPPHIQPPTPCPRVPVFLLSHEPNKRIRVRCTFDCAFVRSTVDELYLDLFVDS